MFVITILLFSTYKTGTYYYGTYITNKKNDQLVSAVQKETQTTFKTKYSELLETNPDMIGWITIEGTKLDYPVMQTKDDEEFYLRKDFYKNYDYRGTIFVNKEACFNEPNDNMIIYGHNMDDLTMFGTLKKYSSRSFYEKHKTIKFETLYESSIYEIAYVFKTVDNENHPNYVDYSNFIYINDESYFNKQMNKYESLSLYKTTVTPKFKEQLLTLSTCEYSNKNGRLVIIARKISNF